jgi:hypothetical protein
MIIIYHFLQTCTQRVGALHFAGKTLKETAQKEGFVDGRFHCWSADD